MKEKELYDRRWQKNKRTQHQDNARIFTGRRDGKYYQGGTPRSRPTGEVVSKPAPTKRR